MTSAGLKSGTVVGDRYLVERILGHSDLGGEYLCRDLLERKCPVVLKTLTEWDGAGGMEGLRHELSMLSRVRHPHLAPVIDFGVLEEGGAPYLVRAFIDGTDILKASAAWNREEILLQLARICRVLQFLHSRGIVHRHLRPANVMIAGTQGGECEPKLVDFGLDRRPRRGRRDRAPLAFTAPEILLGHGCSPRSDLYSLGIITYQLLTRRLPFDDEDEGYLVQKQLQGKPDMRPVERLEGGSGLAQVLLGLLEKEPEKRPSSAEDVVRLLSAASGRDYSDAVPASEEAYFSPGRFVGRAREMAFLQERAHKVRATGRGGTVFLVGESGSGKTRCLEEMRTWGLLEGWRVVEAGCQPREDRSYGPYRRILDRAALLHSAGADPAGDEPIFRFESASRVAEPLPLEMSSGAAAGPFRDQLTREVVRLMAVRPTLLFLHDFHWADEATVTVLDYLTSDILAHPVFLCVTLRPPESEQSPLARLIDLGSRQQRGEVLALENLSASEVEELVGGITGEPALGKDLGSWVHRASGGNPFFVEEILKHLVDRELLQRASGKWRLAAAGFDQLQAPSSVAAVLRHRLGQLSPRAVELTEWLALFRRAVTKDELRRLVPWSSGDLESSLSELISRQIVCEAAGGGGVLEFRHALVSEVIAGGLPEKKRRRMHQKIGEVLEQLYGEQENLQELAMHFTEGVRSEKALAYALRAARACKAEFAYESALRFYEYLLRQKTRWTEVSFGVPLEAAETLCASGFPKRAIDILKSEAARIENSIDNPKIEIQRLIYLALAYRHLGNVRLLMATAKQGIQILESFVVNDRDRQLTAIFLKELAYCALMKSDPPKALLLSKQALDELSRMPNSILIGQLFGLISAIQRISCNLHEALSAAKIAVKLLDPLQPILVLSSAYSHLGVSLTALGRFDIAKTSHDNAVALSKRTRSPIVIAQALSNLAEHLCHSGNFPEAERISGIAYKIVAEISNPGIKHMVAAILAEIRICQGNYSQAKCIIDKLNAMDGEDIPIYSKAHVAYLNAWLCYELGDFDISRRSLDHLKKLESLEAPAYEHELGEVLKAKILSTHGNCSLSFEHLLQMFKILLKKRWPYQLCLVCIEISRITTNNEVAIKYLRRAKKLAFQMKNEFLLAFATLCHAGIILANQNNNENGHERRDLKSILVNLLKSLEKAEQLGALEIIWKLHATIATILELLEEQEDSIFHSRKALEQLGLIANLLPGKRNLSFHNHPDRYQLAQQCRNRIAANSSLHLSSGIEQDHLRDLLRLNHKTNSIKDINTLLLNIGEFICNNFGMERVLLQINDRNGQPSITTKVNFEEKGEGKIDRIANRIIKNVAITGDPFISCNALQDVRLDSDEAFAGLGKTIFCANLRIGSKRIGIIYADHCRPEPHISESRINFFAAICNMASAAIDNCLAHQALLYEKSALEKRLLKSECQFPEIIGNSKAILHLKEKIAIAAVSPLDVLIWGESGTGKELVARALHYAGRNASGKFVALDCGAFAEGLVESELFGYKKGAFTGALENREGLFEIADRGTIFLDEISNLSMRLQRKLLRVLQEREIRRIGDSQNRKINVRIIAASNKNIRNEVIADRFRKDLYFRLNAMEIHVPALRDREGDIPFLLESFLIQIAERENGIIKRLSENSRKSLEKYSYPGNVRELRNIIEGAYYSSREEMIQLNDLPEYLNEEESNFILRDEGKNALDCYKRIAGGLSSFEDTIKLPFLKRQISASYVRKIIHYALQNSNGKYKQAFKLLGISDQKYAVMLQFLKRNKCCHDYRSYRR
jgi:Nif-specific regulatory protein